MISDVLLTLGVVTFIALLSLFLTWAIIKMDSK